MHLFTVVQLTCLSLLWVVMATAAALAFPFMLLLTIPVRMLLLPRLFNRRELQSVSHTWSSLARGTEHGLLLTPVNANKSHCQGRLANRWKWGVAPPGAPLP